MNRHDAKKSALEKEGRRTDPTLISALLCLLSGLDRGLSTLHLCVVPSNVQLALKELNPKAMVAHLWHWPLPVG